LRRPLAFALVAALAACGSDDRTGVYPAHGIVQDVIVEYDQVVIAHDEIPGLMSAMTMNFDVPDGELLSRMRPGQEIDFEVEFTGKSYRVVSFRQVGEGDDVSWTAPRQPLAEVRMRAPGFRLIDQTGERLSLEDLRGHWVLLDFIFTNCPGPCPILTGTHVALQRRLEPALRQRTRFVSISVDPERDTPEALQAYARARGADLSDWSFLTGSSEEVGDVLERYGIGARPAQGGEIEHIVVTYLIDPDGLIARRYLGLEHEAEEIERDLRALL
jgi:protein SCO1/2